MSKQSYYRSLIRTAMKQSHSVYPNSGTKKWEKIEKDISKNIGVVVRSWQNYIKSLKEAESFAQFFYPTTLPEVQRLIRPMVEEFEEHQTVALRSIRRLDAIRDLFKDLDFNDEG